jgi:hypothetical protein
VIAEHVETNREDWTHRFAAQLVAETGMPAAVALKCAVRAAEENVEQNGDEWLDPEDDADVEISYMTAGD